MVGVVRQVNAVDKGGIQDNVIAINMLYDAVLLQRHDPAGILVHAVINNKSAWPRPSRVSTKSVGFNCKILQVRNKNFQRMVALKPNFSKRPCGETLHEKKQFLIPAAALIPTNFFKTSC